MTTEEIEFMESLLTDVNASLETNRKRLEQLQFSIFHTQERVNDFFNILNRMKEDNARKSGN